MSSEVKILLGLGVVCAIFIAIVVVFSSSGQKATGSSADALVRADSNKIEVKDAKVTMVEFGDYECPACKAAQPVVDQIRHDYAGKITYVFRNFPLPQHTNAKPAAEAAEAAGEQGKYWEMNDLLYSRQDEWVNLSNPNDKFVSYAEELKLDIGKFKSAIENYKFDQKIKADTTDGETLGVNSTPTFFINGEKIVGGQSYDEFKKKIDALLK